MAEKVPLQDKVATVGDDFQSNWFKLVENGSKIGLGFPNVKTALSRRPKIPEKCRLKKGHALGLLQGSTGLSQKQPKKKRKKTLKGVPRSAGEQTRQRVANEPKTRNKPKKLKKNTSEGQLDGNKQTLSKGATGRKIWSKRSHCKTKLGMIFNHIGLNSLRMGQKEVLGFLTWARKRPEIQECQNRTFQKAQDPPPKKRVMPLAF